MILTSHFVHKQSTRHVSTEASRFALTFLMQLDVQPDAGAVDGLRSLLLSLRKIKDPLGHTSSIALRYRGFPRGFASFSSNAPQHSTPSLRRTCLWLKKLHGVFPGFLPKIPFAQFPSG